MKLTYKFRLRDKCASELNRQARAVNVVWNYCNDAQRYMAQNGRRWLSWQDLQKMTAGASKELDIHAHTIQQVCQMYDRSRNTNRKAWLRYRGRRSLGWVPFNTGHVTFDGAAFVFRGRRYMPMHSREIPDGAALAASSFNQDSRGRWYLNAMVEVGMASSANTESVGIDLGLKTLATLSDGRKFEMPSFYRESEAALVAHQRAQKTRRIKAVHRKVANRRRDFIHKLSKALSTQYGLIFIGDVSPSNLARTKLAKSVNDAGWFNLKSCLSYKTHLRGGRCFEVPERLTTQTCSKCGALPASRPRGIAGLSKRTWLCDDCGTILDRDVNAAANILRIGLDTLRAGAPPQGSSQASRSQEGLVA